MFTKKLIYKLFNLFIIYLLFDNNKIMYFDYFIDYI